VAPGGGHSPEDTLDKADPEILADDTRLYVTMAARMCVPALHPYDFVPVANDFINHLRDFQDVGGAHLDLTPVQQQADLFREAALRLREKAARVAAEGSDPTHLNAGMRALSRILNPALFTIAGAYEFDPALQLPVLPGLAPVQELATLDPASDDYRFLRTQLLRQRNRIEDALMQATALANSLAAN